MAHKNRTVANLVAPIIVALCVAPLVGCGGTTQSTSAETHDHDHDHHDHDHGHRPASLHEAVHELTEIRDAVRAAILEGDPDDAHDPLHEVGELLEVLPDVAADTDLPKEEWDAVKAANERLFDAFGKVDKAFHTKDGDKKAAYEEVATDLDEAIEEIRARLPQTGEEPHHEGEHGDDHDHDHEEGHDHDHDHEDDEEDSDDAAPAKPADAGAVVE